MQARPSGNGLYLKWTRPDATGQQCLRLSRVLVSAKQSAWPPTFAAPHLNRRVNDPPMVVNGHSRPTRTPNLWVSAASSFSEPEWIELGWETPRTIREVQLLFDSALHLHFWPSWQGYPVRSVPSIARDYRLIARHADGSASTITEVTGNFQRNRRHRMALEGITGLRAGGILRSCPWLA